jgi:L-lactate dehydrogenase complex protein LldE
MRIALFITCVADAMFPEAGKATVTVLERLGHEVVFPENQTCCGQMHVNSGYQPEARRLAQRMIEIFHGHDAVVAPSSSCVGAVRHLYPEVLGIRHAVCERVFELSEFLVHRLGVEDVGAVFPHRVAYHPTCHSLRVTKVGDAPVRLLQHVRELELVPLVRAEECCGFGGTFSLKNADTSRRAARSTAPRSTGPVCCRSVAGSPGTAVPSDQSTSPRSSPRHESAGRELPRGRAPRARKRPASREPPQRD